jgi:hypothetical protein
MQVLEAIERCTAARTLALDGLKLCMSMPPPAVPLSDDEWKPCRDALQSVWQDKSEAAIDRVYAANLHANLCSAATSRELQIKHSRYIARGARLSLAVTAEDRKVQRWGWRHDTSILLTLSGRPLGSIYPINVDQFFDELATVERHSLDPGVLELAKEMYRKSGMPDAVAEQHAKAVLEEEKKGEGEPGCACEWCDVKATEKVLRKCKNCNWAWCATRKLCSDSSTPSHVIWLPFHC